MDNNEFRKAAHDLVDWMADYIENLKAYPVKPQISPGDIKKQLPLNAPLKGEPFKEIFKDFESIILPGVTHWQHPNFFAYFPTGASEPSILGEMLSATLGIIGQTWHTSPSAEELEERVINWLRDMFGFPTDFTGVIQDSASTSTLVALLTAREKYSKYSINQSGFKGKEKFRIYGSNQVHSSIDKAVKIAGFGIENLIKIDVDENFALIPSKLEEAIQKDIAAGFTPLCVISNIGTTSSTAIDPIESVGKICQKYHCWHHIDAAYAGTALLLPEMRWMSKGIELVDSCVINPHKWMFTNFDCSAYFIKDKKALIDTFSIMPEYLKTPVDKIVNNYRDWGIALGRRFRALKLWFVICSYGVEGLQEKIRNHLSYAQWLKGQVLSTPGFELMAPVPLSLVCFRVKPEGINDESELEKINSKLLESLNASGKILLTQTKLNDKYVIRFVIGSTHVTLDDVKTGWNLIKEYAALDRR